MNTEELELEEGLRQLGVERLRLLELAKTREKSLLAQLGRTQSLIEELSNTSAKPKTKRRTSGDKSPPKHVTKTYMEGLVDAFLLKNPNTNSQEAWKSINDQFRKEGFQPQGAKRIFDLVFDSKTCILNS